MRILGSRLLALFHRGRGDAELEEELRFHLDMEEQENRRKGMSAANARRAARRNFGNVTSTREQHREQRGFRALEALAQNIRYGSRILTRHGGSYAFAIAVLAIGIGASTSLFSLVQSVLLKPLPFPEQDSLRVIWKADPKSGAPFLELAYPELLDLQAGVEAFEYVAVMPTTLYGYDKVMDVGGQDPIRIESTPVSPDFFRTLGVAPALGRDFSGEDNHSGAAPVLILSYRVWREHFGADRDIIGRLVRLNGVGYTVVGVMGPDVDFHRGAGLWLPLRVNLNRRMSYMQAIARVRPGYTDDQVHAEVDDLLQRLAREHPGAYSPTQQAVITPLPDYWTGSTRTQLWASFAASLILLVAAGITASNLFLSRTLARIREIATRRSLGATTSQIFAQFGVEGFTAALAAGVGGVLLAWALINLLVLWAPADIPRIAAAGINSDVLLFASAVSLLTAFACSVVPALIATRSDVGTLLREGGERILGTRRGRRVQGAFIVAQTATTVVLLAASLLVVVSVYSMLNTDIGFLHRDALTMNLAVRGPQFDSDRRNVFFTQLLGRLKESPAVSAVAAVLLRPLEGTIGWDMPYQAEFDDSYRPEQLPTSNFQVVTPGYFQAVGTALLKGRDFTNRDTKDAERVAIVSQSLAEQFGKAGHGVIGTRIRFGTRPDDPWWKVVGVAGNTRSRGVTTLSRDIYINYLQTEIPVRYLVVRGQGTPQDLAGLVRHELEKLDPTQAMAAVATIGQLAARNTARQRFNMTLLLTFGIGSLLLAAAGVYSVVAENISERKREIAIKLALGAPRPRLVGRLVATTLGFVLAGELVL